MKCERYEKNIINCTCLKKCVLFLLIGFFVYCEWECINAIIISWHDESALLCIYFAEIIGMLLAVCVRWFIRSFQKNPKKRNPLPEKKWLRLFIGTLAGFVFLIIVSCYFKVQYDMAYNSSSECADFLCREYLYKFFASFIPRAPVSGFLIWLIADKLYQIVIFRQRREKDEKL